MEQFALSFVPERRIYSLRELSDGIRGALERNFTNIWVSGEISGTKLVPSGHCYFTLKDSEAQIRCVCWKLNYWRLKYKPKDGLEIVARGRIDIYEQRSEYQFVVEAIEPRGQGALQLAFEELKKRLAAEGLFDTGRKRPLPRYPRRIGIITSPKGAVIRDFIEILSRRFPGLSIRLFPARVQGAGSVEDICRGLQYFSRGWAEIVVIARGGGSLEDLWTFNEEAVARAIVTSPAPVVSAIGHETDVTIADFAADLRAPTPSAAAEMIVCTRQEVLDQISARRAKLAQALRYRVAILGRRLHQQGIDRATSVFHRILARRTQRVDDLEGRLRALVDAMLTARERRRRTLDGRLRYFDPGPRLRRDRERFNDLCGRLTALAHVQLNKRRRHFERLTAKLEQLNPRLVLARGYAIVLTEKGEIARGAEALPKGSDAKILFAYEAVRARITESPAD